MAVGSTPGEGKKARMMILLRQTKWLLYPVGEQLRAACETAANGLFRVGIGVLFSAAKTWGLAAAALDGSWVDSDVYAPRTSRKNVPRNRRGRPTTREPRSTPRPATRAVARPSP